MQEGVETTVTNLVPCVFVATKCDLPKVKQVPTTCQPISPPPHATAHSHTHPHIQECDVSPEELCKEYELPPPRSVSMTTPDLLSAVYTHLATVARDP